MRLQFVTIGQNLKRPRGRGLARKKGTKGIMTLALPRVIIKTYRFETFIYVFKS